MKLHYSRQLALTCFLILLGNILSSLLKHWIYRNIAFLLGGLICFIHPVMAGCRPPTKKELNLIRFIGGGLILIAFFTRSYTFLYY